MIDTSRIHAFLRDARVPYTVIPHPLAYTAQEEAAVAHVPGREWAKVVSLVVDDDPVQAVLPAPLSVNLDWLLDLARGAEIRLATESELQQWFPDCDAGAMPPFGPLYGQQVYVDVTLAGEAEIVFNAGTHADAICMRWSDFAACVRPIVGRFAAVATDRVGAFRLSYRE